MFTVAVAVVVISGIPEILYLILMRVMVTKGVSRDIPYLHSLKYLNV